MESRVGVSATVTTPDTEQGTEEVNLEVNAAFGGIKRPTLPVNEILVYDTQNTNADF